MEAGENGKSIIFFAALGMVGFRCHLVIYLYRQCGCGGGGQHQFIITIQHASPTHEHMLIPNALRLAILNHKETRDDVLGASDCSKSVHALNSVPRLVVKFSVIDLMRITLPLLPKREMGLSKLIKPIGSSRCVTKRACCNIFSRAFQFQSSNPPSHPKSSSDNHHKMAATVLGKRARALGR